MRLWFAPSSEVPIYRQLMTQVELAILSGELRPGDKLPSTRELARRFALHPNTISAGYRHLERAGWTERRHGSGVYVRGHLQAATTPDQQVDQHIAKFIQTARERKLPLPLIRSRLSQWLATPPPDRFIIVEPDPEMRTILMTEVGAVATLPVEPTSVDECADPARFAAAIALCRPSKTQVVRAALPPGVELVTLPIRSAQDWLAAWLPSPQGYLIAVVSRWPEFLIIARTMLVAARVPQESLLFRDARKPRWNRGLDQVTAILCDAHTAASPLLPVKPFQVVFPLLADSAKAELARYS
jgi:DNA-binding transcriptional regulator YhcF (GntR family)